VRWKPTFSTLPATTSTAEYRVGILEDVSNLGIVASLWFDPDDEEEEPPVSTFYPWSSVVWLKPVEET
jgi:hypothetical protein